MFSNYGTTAIYSNQLDKKVEYILSNVYLTYRYLKHFSEEYKG